MSTTNRKRRNLDDSDDFIDSEYKQPQHKKQKRNHKAITRQCNICNTTMKKQRASKRQQLLMCDGCDKEIPTSLFYTCPVWEQLHPPNNKGFRESFELCESCAEDEANDTDKNNNNGNNHNISKNNSDEDTRDNSSSSSNVDDSGNGNNRPLTRRERDKARRRQLYNANKERRKRQQEEQKKNAKQQAERRKNENEKQKRDQSKKTPVSRASSQQHSSKSTNSNDDSNNSRTKPKPEASQIVFPTNKIRKINKRKDKAAEKNKIPLTQTATQTNIPTTNLSDLSSLSTNSDDCSSDKDDLNNNSSIGAAAARAAALLKIKSRKPKGKRPLPSHQYTVRTAGSTLAFRRKSDQAQYSMLQRFQQLNLQPTSTPKQSDINKNNNNINTNNEYTEVGHQPINVGNTFNETSTNNDNKEDDDSGVSGCDDVPQQDSHVRCPMLSKLQTPMFKHGVVSGGVPAVNFFHNNSMNQSGNGFVRQRSNNNNNNSLHNSNQFPRFDNWYNRGTASIFNHNNDNSQSNETHSDGNNDSDDAIENLLLLVGDITGKSRKRQHKPKNSIYGNHSNLGKQSCKSNVNSMSFDSDNEDESSEKTLRATHENELLEAKHIWIDNCQQELDNNIDEPQIYLKIELESNISILRRKLAPFLTVECRKQTSIAVMDDDMKKRFRGIFETNILSHILSLLPINQGCCLDEFAGIEDEIHKIANYHFDRTLHAQVNAKFEKSRSCKKTLCRKIVGENCLHIQETYLANISSKKYKKLSLRYKAVMMTIWSALKNNACDIDNLKKVRLTTERTHQFIRAVFVEMMMAVENDGKSDLQNLKASSKTIRSRTRKTSPKKPNASGRRKSKRGKRTRNSNNYHGSIGNISSDSGDCIYDNGYKSKHRNNNSNNNNNNASSSTRPNRARARSPHHHHRYQSRAKKKTKQKSNTATTNSDDNKNCDDNNGNEPSEMINSGSNCYMNSLIQILGAIPKLQIILAAFSEDDYKAEFKTEIKERQRDMSNARAEIQLARQEITRINQIPKDQRTYNDNHLLQDLQHKYKTNSEEYKRCSGDLKELNHNRKYYKLFRELRVAIQAAHAGKKQQSVIDITHIHDNITFLQRPTASSLSSLRNGDQNDPVEVLDEVINYDPLLKHKLKSLLEFDDILNIECSGCHNISQQRNTGNILRLEPLSDDLGLALPTVQDLITNYQAKRELTGENQYYCSKHCQKLCDATTWHEIRTEAICMAIQLPRIAYSPTGDHRLKDTTMMMINQEISLKNKHDNDVLFDLFGNIIHTNKSNVIRSGHYYCEVKRFKDNDLNTFTVYYCNDNIILDSVDFSLCSSNSYMLFFHRRPNQPLSTSNATKSTTTTTTTSISKHKATTNATTLRKPRKTQPRQRQSPKRQSTHQAYQQHATIVPTLAMTATAAPTVHAHVTVEAEGEKQSNVGGDAAGEEQLPKPNLNSNTLISASVILDAFEPY